MSHLHEASDNITAVIQLENSGPGVWRQLHGKRQAQQVAAERGHAAVANEHLQSVRAACSKQAHAAPDIKGLGGFVYLVLVKYWKRKSKV